MQTVAPTALKKTDKTAASKLITADELLQLPQIDCRYELIKGMLIEMSPAGSK